LQTDPTVIYGLGERYNGKITRAFLKEATPYNTYVISGLPPTPIAMVGREAIHAAMNPVPGNSLYFVARGDGSHVFSADLDAHNAAVKEFQLKRRADYRSSPAPIVVPTPGVDPVPAQKPAVEAAPESTSPEKSPPEPVVPDEKAAEQKPPEQPAAVPETTPQVPDDAEKKGEPSPQ